MTLSYTAGYQKRLPLYKNAIRNAMEIRVQGVLLPPVLVRHSLPGSMFRSDAFDLIVVFYFLIAALNA